jgi:hypothetical protein
MTDYAAIGSDLVHARIAALYHCDDRGRLVSVNQWDGGVAPGFFLMRTADHVVCRFRADLPDDLESAASLRDSCSGAYTLWERIVDALRRRGVELVSETNEHGSGVRWHKPRKLRV